MKDIRFFRTAMVLLCLLVAATQSTPLHAQEGGFTETFDDPSLPGWEFPPERVSVVDGVLYIEPDGFAAPPGAWGDMTLTVRARLLGEGELIISFLATDAGGCAVFLGLDTVRSECTTLQGGGGGGGGGNAILVPGEWTEVRLTVEGGRHEVVLNGEPVMSETIEDMPPGAVILSVGGAAGEFDDLVVVAEGAAPPPESGEALPPEPGVPVSEQPSTGELTWVRTGGPPGGLGYDIRYNFDDPNTWYVTDNFAGVHISTDNGLTWQPSNTGIPGQLGPTSDWTPIFSLTVDPHNPQIVWAGTDKTGHIYRSTDGGRTWEERDNGITIEYDGLTFRGFTVDPRSSDIVYAMGETMSHELGGPLVWSHGIGGVIYRTTDGGENWEEVWDGGMPSSLARYLWINPEDPDILYATTGIFDRGAVGEGNPETDPYPFGGLGILRSRDGGDTWEILNEDNGLQTLYFTSMYMHPDDPDTLLVAAGKNVTDLAAEYMVDNGLNPGGIYRTTDGGDTWTQVLAPPADRPFEVFTAVELCPSDPNIAYAGSDLAIYRSADAGVTWALVTGGHDGWGPPGVLAGKPIDIQCDPRDTNRLFTNNYLGGNFLSEDGGRSWQNASDGYTGAQMLTVAVDPRDPYHVYAVGRNGIWASDNGGSHWYGLRYPPEGRVVWGVEWSAIALDPSNPDHVLASEETIWESFDGGVSWEVRSTPRMMGAAIIFAPSHPTTVYAASADPGCIVYAEVECGPAAGVFVSHDGGTMWGSASDDTISALAILDLAVDPTDEQIVFAASELGLFGTADGGGSWALIGGMPEGAAVRAVAINPDDAQNVLAAVDGHGVYISHDGGVTWEASVAGLEPNSAYRDILFDPTNPQIIYVSDIMSGVYRSSDGGSSWLRINNGLTTRTAEGLAISADGQTIYVATNGEGVFRLDVSSSPPESSPEGELAAEAEEGGTGGGFCPSSYAPLVVIPAAILTIWRRKRFIE